MPATQADKLGSMRPRSLRSCPLLLTVACSSASPARPVPSQNASPPPASSAAPTRPPEAQGPGEPCTLVRVIDGDTVEAGLNSGREHVRLLAIDTEESIASSSKPVTPFGRETSKWAKEWLRAGEACWLEYGPERRDVYSRLLAYLWHEAGGVWRMYNLEAVARGYSPYFTKYGYSREHHGAFVAAEREAREGRRGIWDPRRASELRGNYLGPNGLKALWDDRAEALTRFEALQASRPDIVALRTGYDEAWRRLGERVTVFTAVRTAEREGALWVGKCESKPREPFAVVLPAGDTAGVVTLEAALERYVYFTGILERGPHGLWLRLASAADARREPPPLEPP
jgi:endonuclease YncB( thermonuclease family)